MKKKKPEEAKKKICAGNYIEKTFYIIYIAE